MRDDRVRIRFGRAEDAGEVARLANRLSVHEGKGPDVFSPDRVLADLLAPEAPLKTLVAERDGRLVGYAAYEASYNTDRAERALWLHDIYVEEAARGHGVGQTLMAAVARAAVAGGLTSVSWGVHGRNRRARAFYAALGARDEDVRLIELDGEALISLAARAAIAD